MSALAPRPAPTSSSAVAKPRALRWTVPRLSMAAVKPASPGLSRGSASEPAGTLARSANVGVAWFSCTMTEMPLARENRDTRRLGARAACARGRAMGRSPRFGRSTRADASRGGGAAGPPPSDGTKCPTVRVSTVNVLLRHRLDVVGGQRAHPVEIGREIAPVADHRPVAELTGLRRHAVRLEDEVGLGAPLGAGQLLGGDGARRHALDLVEERLLQLLRGDPAARGGAHVKRKGSRRLGDPASTRVASPFSTSPW